MPSLPITKRVQQQREYWRCVTFHHHRPHYEKWTVWCHWSYDHYTSGTEVWQMSEYILKIFVTVYIK